MSDDTLGRLLDAIRAEERDKMQVEFHNRLEELDGMEAELKKQAAQAEAQVKTQTARAEAMRDQLLGVASRLELFAQELLDVLQ